MEQDKKIYVETLLTQEEFLICRNRYSTYHKDSKYPTFFQSEFGWRQGMGKGFGESEMNVMNTRLEALKQKR